MVILTVGAASLLSLFAAAASTHKRSVDRTHAALVAEMVLAEARVAYRPGSEPEEIAAQVRGRLGEEVGDYRYELFLFHPQGEEWDESELFARVEVRWRQSGQVRAERFSTILLPNHRLGDIEEESKSRK
jgi:hypothetical protein